MLNQKPGMCTANILLMEEEEAVRNLMDRLLKKYGYAVALAKGGMEAIELYQKAKESGQPFDAVIMDLTVNSGIGGKETMVKLLEMDPYAKGIISSGYHYDPAMTHFKDYGFCAAIQKPFAVSELFHTLQSILK